MTNQTIIRNLTLQIGEQKKLLYHEWAVTLTETVICKE